SEVNQDILSKIKEVLKKEHGGEHFPWTDLQMEAQFLRYFRMVKEKCQRIKKGKNEEHKQRCKMSRRLTSKLDRRCGAFELIRESLSSSQKQLAPEVLCVEYMSSEESAYEDEEDPITGEVIQKLKGYLTKKLSWERTALTNLKSKLDRAHYRSLTPHAKALAKPKFEGDISKIPAPDGPSWAVRQAIAQ
ncbi:unnamed protein product, partial [Porites lobata]